LRAWRWCSDADPADIGVGKRFVTLEGNAVQIWNAKTGRLVRVLQWCPNADDIVFAAPSPNGHKIVTVSTNNSVQVLKARNGRPLRGLFGREDAEPIDRAAVTSGGHKVITVSGDTVLIWKLP
jgi:WD40 repeat protein